LPVKPDVVVNAEFPRETGEHLFPFPGIPGNRGAERQEQRETRE